MNTNQEDKSLMTHSCKPEWGTVQIVKGKAFYRFDFTGFEDIEMAWKIVCRTRKMLEGIGWAMGDIALGNDCIRAFLVPLQKPEDQNPAKPTECEEFVIEKIRRRRDAGRQKYGTTMERSDLTRPQWLQHAQEEAMDLAIYLERLIREENAAGK